MRKILIVLIAIALFAGCIDRGSVELMNWPDGRTSAVAITFETERATQAQLQTLGEVLKNRGIRATFFVVPGYFESNPRALDPLRDFEVASMGWYQTNWKDAALTKEFQEAEIKRAHDWLTAQGFEVRGFKAPFLKNNKETYEALLDMHYVYDSSKYYGFMPYWVDGIVEIPLSVNYDLYWDERSMSYSTMPAYMAFQRSHDESGLFTFYGHADRTYEHIENFTALIDYAGKRNVWFASASEIADWWVKRGRLDLQRTNSEVTVRNNGAGLVSGATVKIGGYRGVEGAASVKKIEGELYAVLPDIGPGKAVSIRLIK